METLEESEEPRLAKEGRTGPGGLTQQPKVPAVSSRGIAPGSGSRVSARPKQSDHLLFIYFFSPSHLPMFTPWLGSLLSSALLFLFVLVIVPGQRERSPVYQKLHSRGIHIWDTRRGQPTRSAMDGPRPGTTAFVITVKILSQVSIKKKRGPPRRTSYVADAGLAPSATCSCPGPTRPSSGRLTQLLQNVACIGRESNPGRPRGRRAFYH